MSMSRITGGNSRRVLATVGVIGAVGALAAGTYSQFTGSTSVAQNLSTGTLTLTATDAASMAIDATNVAPGDTVQRAVTITPGGTVDLSAMTVTTTAGSSNLLTTDTVNGLAMRIDRCTSASTVNPDGSYSCAGAVDLTGVTPVIQTDLNLTGAALTAGTPNYLRITLTLPTSADDTFQGLSNAITYTFKGAQRAGTFK